MTFTNPKHASAYILTPTGAPISEDEYNVGQKLLKKMGWTPETGLGKNRDGIVDPIKASCNYGRKGLGKNSSLSSSGMVQQSAFNALLRSLNNNKSSTCNEIKTKLEDKSKQSRSRVHYGKFVRAKDVSQYSRESLKIVLGSSTDGTSDFPEGDVATSIPDNSEPPDSDVKQEFGVKTYSSSTDLASYFSMKRMALKSDIAESLPKRKREVPVDRALMDSIAFCRNTNDDHRDISSSIGSDVVGINFLEPNEVSPKGETLIKIKETHDSEVEKTIKKEPTNIDEGHQAWSLAFPNSNINSLDGYPYY